MKKFLLSLSILILGITNFSYGDNSYTCNYQNIIDEVANSNGSSTTYSFSDCRSFGRYYNCSIYNEISVSNGYCYQIELFDSSYIIDANINLDLGGTPIEFSSSNNNLDDLNGYIVCDPSYFKLQGSTLVSVSDLSFTIITIPKDSITNYSYTYTCPTCDTSSLENQLNTCHSNLATATGSLATCQSDLNSCQNSSGSCDYSSYESQINTLSGNLATCQGMYDRLNSDYDLLSGNYYTCTNELSICLQNGGSSGSGDIQWSSLFINQVQHLGNKNIYIDIPLEYEYSYTNEGDDFELTVLGLEQDEEYLSGVINKQNYIPTTEDFSNVFSNLGLFGGLLVVCLFVILVFYMIKKIFN